MPEMPGGASSQPANPPAEGSIEDRIKGFQRLIDDRDRQMRELRNELKQLKTAGLSEEEQEQLREQEKDTRIAELEAQLELQRLSQDYPTEVVYFQELLAADDAPSQLAVLRKFAESFKPQAPAAPPAPAEPGLPEFDFNRPLRAAFEGTVLSDGTLMNDQIADAILNSAGPRQADITQRESGS